MSAKTSPTGIGNNLEQPQDPRIGIVDEELQKVLGRPRVPEAETPQQKAERVEKQVLWREALGDY